jgi:hypothetical protein
MFNEKKDRTIYIDYFHYYYIRQAKIKATKLENIIANVPVFIGTAELQRLPGQHTLAVLMMPASS